MYRIKKKKKKEQEENFSCFTSISRLQFYVKRLRVSGEINVKGLRWNFFGGSTFDDRIYRAFRAEYKLHFGGGMKETSYVGAELSR